MANPETDRARLWVRKKIFNVASVTLPSGEVVHQIKHMPYKVPDPVIVYDKEAGLGPVFCTWDYYRIREFLDDYLDLPSILKLGTVSREWNYFTSDEKLWRRFARRHYKGDFDFLYYWKSSVVRHHNTQAYKQQGKVYEPVKITPPDRAVVPYFEGMEEECIHDFKVWFRAASNPKYFEVTAPDQVDRRDADELTVEEFYEKYEKPGIPVLINGLTRDWAAAKTWNKKDLVDTHGDVKFRTGSGFKMSMRKYFQYLDTQHEMQPLYLFDQNYPFRAKPMGTDYTVPKYFPEDLFEVVGEDDRPPYRWVLIGPAGSGVPFHTDPRGTSAWNTVLIGQKRWAFYPPHVHPPGVGPNSADYYDAPTAVKWYHKHLPLLPTASRPMECLQRAGETIFVPSQWWHMVYNSGTETVIAVTHNYASHRNFKHVVPTLYEEDDDKFRPLFKKKLATEYPELLEKIIAYQKEHNKPDDQTVSTSSSSYSTSSCSSSEEEEAPASSQEEQ